MPLRNMNNEVLTQQIIDKDIRISLQHKPQLSIFKDPTQTDNDDYDPCDDYIPSIEPPIPSSITLSIPTYHCMDTPMMCDGKHTNVQTASAITIDYFNFMINYKDFASHCKLDLTFSISIQSSSSNESPLFNILIKPLSNNSESFNTECTVHDTTFDEYNLYSKLNSIKLLSVDQKRRKWFYKINVTLAVTKALKNIRKHIKLFVCLNYRKHCTQTVAVIPITYFSLLKRIFICNVYELFGIIILNDIYSMIMQYSGKLHWCLGAPFIYDTLNIHDHEKVNGIDIEQIDKGINPKIKNLYCVTSMDRNIIQTRLIGINLLLYNTDIDEIETVREPIESYTDFLCIKYKQFKVDERYNSENNVILAKCIALDLNTKILKNQYGKLDFMLWIEWKDSIMPLSLDDLQLHKRLCNSSLSDLINWYEMKRVIKENKMKTLQRNRVKCVKQQRQNRQKHKKRDGVFSKNKYKYSHKRHLYNRW